MDDRKLIEEMIEGAYPLVEDIMRAVQLEQRQQLAEALTEYDIPLEPTDAPPSELGEKIMRIIWRAPLTDMAVHLLWAIAAEAGAGEFVATEPALAEACAAVTDDELRRVSGLSGTRARNVLEKLAESLAGVVRSQGVVDVMIDRRPYRLRAADA